MVMKRTSIGLIGTGEPLIRQALESIRKAHEAEPSGLPADEVLRLKLLTDSLYQAVIAFQLGKASEPPSIIR
jgi:hypothetical protein